MEAYRRWLTPSRSRAWWNSGDILEYVCRVLLRSHEYKRTYTMALTMSQRSTRLKYLFRPILPLAEPKFLNCEKETVRRWEMRQSLENINSRIATVRVRDGDAEVAVNTLLDEFDDAVQQFMKFLRKFNKMDHTSVNEEIPQKLDRSKLHQVLKMRSKSRDEEEELGIDY